MSFNGLRFELDGKTSLVPDNWQGITEVLIYGDNSNQPLIAGEKWTFSGDSAKAISKHVNQKGVTKPIDVALIAEQDGIVVDLFDGFIINPMDDYTEIDPDFNGENSPLRVEVTIEKAKSVNTLEDSLGGLTWGLLDHKGLVKDSDYTIVKTAVQKLYDGTEVGLAIISLFVIRLQIKDLVADSREFIQDSAQRLSGLDAAAKLGAIIYIVIVTALRVAAIIVLVGLLVKTIVDLLTILVPVIVRNKAIGWRKGYEIIFKSLGYGFVSNLKELDQEVILPSKSHSNSKNITLNLLPSYPANLKGYPGPTDAGYLASDFVAEGRKRFNARFDVIGNNVVMRWKGDPSLFKLGTFRPAIDVKTERVVKNTKDIPNTRLIDFKTDVNDDYTLENYKGTSYEVANISKNLPFKGTDLISMGYALGSSKDRLTSIEKLMLVVAKAADALASLGGVSPKLESKLRSNRSNVLKISQNTFSVAKLLPIINGQMPENHRSITSAKAIENKYYINESIKRGTGQKLLVENYTMPFNLKDREAIIQNGNFIDDKGREVTIRELEFTYSEDTAILRLEINSPYIADGEYDEEIIEPE